MVVGSNVFSDFAAGWTDFFCGRAGTYERKLQDISRIAPLVLSVIQHNYNLVDLETKERLEKLYKYFRVIDSGLASTILFDELQSLKILLNFC